MSGTPLLSIAHASVRRGGKYILDDVSFDLYEGQNTAIIGPNGAGKSTLVNVMCREVHPLARVEYSYSLFGSTRWPVARLRLVLGHVSQAETMLIDTTYTVYEIVLSALYSAIGLDFHITPTDEDRRKALEAIAKVGLTHLMDKPVNTLSSGEKAKALIARSAVNDPPVMLLDEASNALDFPSRAEFRRTVSSYARDGKTIVMVTHELAEIIEEVSRVVVMKGGRIVADGPKEEILDEDLLSEVYGQRVYIDRRGGLYTAWC